MEMTFIRVRSAKDVIVSAVLLISGFVLLILPTSAGVNITGFFMIFAGVITAMALKSGYRCTETGERCRKKELFFQQVMFPLLTAALECAPASIDLTQEDKGSAVRLDIYYCKESGKAYLQLFEYIPYKYESCSRIYEYKMSEVAKLIK